jgi:hypothetical protein
MRLLGSPPPTLSLVIALLSPSLASAQTDAGCVAVYDANGTRVARAYEPGNQTNIVFTDQGRAARTLPLEKCPLKKRGGDARSGVQMLSQCSTFISVIKTGE